LPNALTPPDFNLTSTAQWQPVGPAQNIASLQPNQPVVVSWDWTVPISAATHSCLLAVVSGDEDPITTLETNVNVLVDSEKRVCLKNLHVVGPSPSPLQTLVTINFHNALSTADVIDIVVDPKRFQGGTVGMVLEPVEFANRDGALVGVSTYRLREGEDIGRFPGEGNQTMEQNAQRSAMLARLDRTILYEFDPVKRSEIRGIKLAPGQTLHALVSCKGSSNVPYSEAQQFAVMQRQGGSIIGGSTYEVRLLRAARPHPVSRIRVLLESVHVPSHLFEDKELTSLISFNDDPFRRHTRSIEPSEHQQICVFDGYVAEEDNMEFTLLRADEDENATVYRHRFDSPPEAWVGEYEMKPGPKGHSTSLRYRIESVPFDGAGTQAD
jgi:hypothetical protein